MRRVGVWTVLVTCLLQIGGWVVDQIPTALSLPRPPSWVWTMTCLVNAALVYGPARLLSRRGGTVRARMAGRIWSTAAGALAVLGLARLVPLPHDEFALGALALITALVAVGVRMFLGWERPAGRFSGWAVAVGLASLLPWLYYGALGGRLETALAVLAGVATGALARSVLDGRFWAAYATPGATGAGRLPAPVDQGVAGTVAGVALVVLAGGVGAFGVHLLELLILPPLGYVAARLQHTWLLVGIASLGPLAFVDPQELTVVLGLHDVLYFALLAALASLAIAILAAMLLPGQLRRGLAAATAMTLAAGSLYVFAGQTGFYGNRLFVIMKAQADLTGVTGGAAVHRTLVELAETSQVDIRRTLSRRGVHFTPYYLVNAIELDGGPLIRELLTSRADVDRVLIEQRLRPVRDRTPPEGGDLPAPTGPTWDIRDIGADRAWGLGATGRGILIGHTDTGVDGTHPSLEPGFRGGADSWHDPWNGTTRPTDLDGHGTGTLSLAVGRGGVGAAPDAQWIACSNTARNMASPGKHLDCLQFMLAPFPAGGDPFHDGRPDRAPRILTNSWTCTDVEGCDPDALLPAARAFEAAGVFVAVAAGNAGPFCRSITEPPATYPQSLTVGATNDEDQVAGYSSRGPVGGLVKPELHAPGTGVVLARPGDGYGTAFGTSMSTPLVAGTVALLWSARPELVGDLPRTRQLLTSTARPTTRPPKSRLLLGPRKCGRVGKPVIVDAYAAVAAALGRS